MYAIPYSVSGLINCIGYKDLRFFGTLTKKEARIKLSQDTVALIENGNIFQNPIRKTIIRGKDAFKFIDTRAELATRLISKNIRYNYQVRQSDRHNIISTLLGLLHDGTPYHIYRFDIKEFYESVDRNFLLAQLIEDGKCSPQTIKLLNDLFLIFDYHYIKGLPRGLSISSTLSEVYLKSFDAAIKKRDDVFFYSRFVDDIIVIASGSTKKSEMEKMIEEALPPSINFHKEAKRNHLVLPKIKNTSSKPKEFDYLGYRFNIYESFSSNNSSHREKRNVTIDISPEKVARIKQRLASSFACYITGSQSADEYLLLKDRIRALTGNYTINDPMTGIKIRTGIYFNYKHANIANKSSLKELDAFYNTLLFSKKNKLAQRIAKTITLQERRQLSGYTFSSGFGDIRYHSFSFKALKKIKECWRK